MSNTWEQSVRAREEENRIAFLAADVAELDRLWTDDFAVNSPIKVANDKRRCWRCSRPAASGTPRWLSRSSTWPARATWWS